MCDVCKLWWDSWEDVFVLLFCARVIKVVHGILWCDEVFDDGKLDLIGCFKLGSGEEWDEGDMWLEYRVVRALRDILFPAGEERSTVLRLLRLIGVCLYCLS